MKTCKAWMLDQDTRTLTWHAGRTPSEVRWLTLVEDAVFGSLWGPQLRLMAKAGAMPADALHQGALAD
jgi:hypothetical protein